MMRRDGGTNGWRRVRAGLLVGALTLPVGGVAWGQGSSAADDGGAPVSTALEVKSTLDAAMPVPLAERVPALEALERRIAADAMAGGSTPRDQAALYWYLFRTRQELARYPESREAFGQHIAAVKRAFDPREGGAIVKKTIDRLYRRGDPLEAVALIGAALESYPDDAEVTPLLLLRKGEALNRLHGRRGEAIAPLTTLIGQYPDSRRRPYAMRLLANVQVSTSKNQQALQTLALIQRQYAGTWWEQWAHIHQAQIWERRKGDPQRALQIYTESLKKFPNHHYAGYVRDQIARVQGVIEQQMIRDALDGLGKKDEEAAPGEGEALGRADDAILVDDGPLSLATPQGEVVSEADHPGR